jgi:hypothetical protein
MLNETVTVELKFIVTVFCFAAMEFIQIHAL